jgi:hypothetical protein
MLQAGHGGYRELSDSVKHLINAVNRTPKMAAINGEVCYEGILGSSYSDIQRFLFWSTMLSGAAGHTYGANGIWQFNEKGNLFGASPHGATWGNTLWKEAYKFSGSLQIGLGKKLLENYEWWRFEPHDEWLELCNEKTDNYTKPYIAGIPSEVRIFYFPFPIVSWGSPLFVKNFEPNIRYKAFYFDPQNAQKYPLGIVKLNIDGKWQIPKPPIIQDWVLILECSK